MGTDQTGKHKWLSSLALLFPILAACSAPETLPADPAPQTNSFQGEAAVNAATGSVLDSTWDLLERELEQKRGSEKSLSSAAIKGRCLQHTDDAMNRPCSGIVLVLVDLSNYFEIAIKPNKDGTFETKTEPGRYYSLRADGHSIRVEPFGPIRSGNMVTVYVH